MKNPRRVFLMTVAASSGASLRQRSVRKRQRGLNTQPAGRSAMPGTMPGMVARRRLSRLRSGKASSNAAV